MDQKLLLQLAAVFFATQILGLFTANFLLEQNITVQIVNEDKESIDNSIGLFAYIIGFTALLLLFTKFFKGHHLYFLLKAFETLAIFGTSLIVFSTINEVAGLVLAIALVGSRLIFRENLLLRNVSSVTSTAGAGALIGVSLGVTPIIIFMVLLAIYDYIAVFKTKHMVELAKNVTNKNLSFTFALPTKEHKFELGTGDIVIPLAFAVSVLAQTKTTLMHPFYLISPVLIILASFVGLVLTLEYISKRIGIALPALPPQTVLMLIAFFGASFFGF